MSQLIVVENQSTVLNATDFYNAVWSVDYQVRYHYGRSRWVSGYFAPAGQVVRQPGNPVPGGAWQVTLSDTSDQAGALGYHDEQNMVQSAHSVRTRDSAGIPYAKVFCKDALNDGMSPSAVLSHEVLEMLVDPHTNVPRTALRADTQELYIVEVGDPVQGNDYDIGAPEGRRCGTLVADFALPAWWKLEPGSALSFRHAVSEPWRIAPQGYMSTAPVNDPTNWSQVYGSETLKKENPL